MKNLSEKVIVITGAGSGIGRELALQLAREGAHLALNDWNTETLSETLALVEEQGRGTAITHPFDVSDRSAWEQFTKIVQSHYGKVDGLINNAGLTVFPETLPETDPVDFERVLQVNLWGTIHGSQVFLPLLMEQQDSLLVNISSILGIVGFAGQGPYVTTKFAVRGFTETLRQELAGTGVQVVCVHPGPVKTNLTRNIKTDDQQLLAQLSKYFEEAAKTTPEQAAKLIIAGVKKGRNRIVFGQNTGFLDYISRLLPNRYHKLMPRNFRPGRLIKKALAARAADKKEVLVGK